MLLVVCQLSLDVIGYEDSNVIGAFPSVFLSQLNSHLFSGCVYTRKLALARVSYRHDFLISYRVYMMTGLFHISLFEGTLHVDKMHI